MRLTKQQLLDAIAAVVAQGRLSYFEGEGCKYAMPDDPNINCVVGKLMTSEQRAEADALESDALESDTGIEWVNHNHNFFDELDVPLLQKLQSAHDDACDLEQFEQSALKIVEDNFDESSN